MKKFLKPICLLLATIFVLASCGTKNDIETTESTDETTEIGEIVSDEIIPPEDDDPLKEEIDFLEGYVRFQTPNGTQAAPAFDIQQMYVKEMLGKKHADTMMKTLAEAGYTRVYITVPGDGLPAFSATRDNANTSERDYRYERNLKACNGNIMKFYNDYAHDYGLKMIAIYKPYEGGGGLTIPEGEIADNCDFYEDTIGGRRIYFDNFVKEHPEMRLVRRDDKYIVDPNKNITGIEGVFVLDEIKNYLGGVEYGAVTASQIGEPNIDVYISDDNHTYTKYTGTKTITWTEEKRDVYDANGLLKIENANVYVMRITGLDLTPDTYVALEVAEDLCWNLRTIPYSMLSLYSGNEKLVTSATIWIRDVWGIGGTEPYVANNGKGILWGYEREPTRSVGASLYGTWTDGMGRERRSLHDMYTNYGFEFEYAGSGNGGEGWATSAKVYGLAVGKPQYVGGALCEGYEEVRQFWLDYTIYLLDDCSFDGIEYRMIGHSTFITDPINYGYNEPIVEKYKELYGVDISDPDVEITEKMFIRIMIIRGNFFMEFLEEVDKYTEEHNKFFGMHLIDAYADTSKYYESMKHTNMNSLLSPYRPKIIINWKKCIDMCDNITLKEYTWNNYDPQNCIEIKEYAKEKGKTLWSTAGRVLGEHNWEYAQKLDNDENIGGIVWYEYPGEGALVKIYKRLNFKQVKI